MEWFEFIDIIKKELNQRNLRSPNIRLRVLEKINNILKEYFPNIISNPSSLLRIPKKNLTQQLELMISKKLNGAETSIITHIYNTIKNNSTKIIFYTRETLRTFDGQVVPCFILKKSDWDDFNYRTSFKLYFLKRKNNPELIGDIKILQRSYNESILPKKFESLDSTVFCSLGQSIDYYKELRKIQKQMDVVSVLDRLNDVAYNMGLRTKFENDKGFTKSLIRYSEAEKALQEGKKIIDNIPYANSFNFTFSSKLPNAEKEHFVTIDFSEDVLPKPNRIVAIVGRNGTGKTQILAKLANTLSGNFKEGNILSKYRPPFSKVIAVTYSLFDKFEIPSTSKSFSYVYCGMREVTGRISEKNLLLRLEKSNNQIIEKKRQAFYLRLLENVIDKNTINIVLDEFGELKKDFIKIARKKKLSLLSSGQTIYIYILSEIIANIEKESLILFDEPETHLHPNAIAKLTNSLYEILDKFDSYAIVGTHSPIVIQQIPSRYVLVFEREGNIPIIRNLGLESFGESLTNITEDIFDIINVDMRYKKDLEKMTKRYSYEEILNIFDKRLSLNAKIYLKQLYFK